MKILVALKQVPARDQQYSVEPGGGSIDESNLQWQINEPDAYALEAALQLKESQGGEVVVLSAGPERVQSSLREALAKGADRAIHIAEPDLSAYDLLDLARLLAAAVRPEAPDVVFTGLQSDDLGLGQTGVVMAELLGLPHATIIMQVEAAEGMLRVKRELEAGWFQHVTLPLPALLTIQSGISKLRYATLMGIKRAKTKELKTIPAAELAVPPRRQVRLGALAAPQRTKQTQLIPGGPAEQAAALVEKLRFEVRAL